MCLLGDNSSCLTRSHAVVVPDYLFNCLYREQPWNIEIGSLSRLRVGFYPINYNKDRVSPRQGSHRLIAITKDLGFRSLNFFPHNDPSAYVGPLDLYSYLGN